ncbi:hypothetical protein ACFOU0_11210 [Salinicoccus sesuvii]|uniref:ATP-grasp domain-containing protein n=1 Tax=Salinicoccus sesuvii TaxID=868281 RepID=A0ABV7N6B5_9STAP
MNEKRNDVSGFPESAHGVALIAYTISLEAWRRGIEVKFFKTFVKNQIKARYTLSYAGREHTFQLSLGDKVSKEARSIGKSKTLTRRYLTDANVSMPEGEVFSVYNSEFCEAIGYAKALGYPVIIKPARASLAIGVHTNIMDEEALVRALDEVHGELGYNDIIIERHVAGEDTRAYVIEDQVIGAFKRVPARVEGDGIQSLEALIDSKNIYRKQNPHLSGNLIEKNDALKTKIRAQGYHMDTIIEKGKRITLSDSTFAKDCSEIVDITDEVSQDYKRTAIQAIRNIPGMPLAGVDIMMDQETDRNYVLEVNCRPNIGGHLYPSVGRSRDIPSAIIDYYFPESTEVDPGYNVNFVYDFDSVTSFLKSGKAQSVTLPALPKKNVENRHFKVTGDVEKVKKWIIKNATGYRLGGSIEDIGTHQLQLIIAGRRRHIEDFLEKMMQTQAGVNIETTKENAWDEVIMYPFDSSHSAFSSVAEHLSDDVENQLKQLQKENKALHKEINKLKESRSWKITKPLRAIGSRKKRK